MAICLPIKAVLLCLAGLFCLPIQASELSPYSLEFQAKAQGFNVKTVRELKKTDGIYRLHQTSNTMMMQTAETSEFSVDDKGSFKPRSYLYQRKIMGNNMLRQTFFHPEKKLATYAEQKATPLHVAIPAEVYDVLSYQEKMRLELIDSDGKFSNRSFFVAEKNRIREFSFSYGGQESIALKPGYLDTIRVERVRKNSTKKTVVWLAKDWDFAIVKIQHLEGDKESYQMELSSGSVNGRIITGSKSVPKPTK